MMLSKRSLYIAVLAVFSLVANVGCAKDFNVFKEFDRYCQMITKEPAKIADIPATLDKDEAWKAFKALSYEEQIKTIVVELVSQPHVNKNILSTNMEQFADQYAAMFAEIADSVLFSYLQLNEICQKMKPAELKGKSEEAVIAALTVASGEIAQAQFTHPDKAEQEKIVKKFQAQHEKAIAIAKEVLMLLVPKKEIKSPVQEEPKK